MANGDILVYLTQDALPYNAYSVRNLIAPFSVDEKIGITFGRQIPYPNATPFARHLRAFNYPNESYIRTFDDRKKYGLKACFSSNSFAAYRKVLLEKIGWFKAGLIVGEDSWASAKILMEGYKIAYISNAMVYHSHNYSLFQEFKRYFDIGVFHKNEKWLIDIFNKTIDEGLKYVYSEIKFLLEHKYYYLIPVSLFRNLLKFLGYKLGYNYKKLPNILVKKISMHYEWWDKFS
jgi:rhamnosyltransferase